MTYFIGYISTLSTFVVIDMAWLATMTPRFYRPTLGDILISGVNLPPALVFYLLYPIGLLVFAMSSGIEKRIDQDRHPLWGSIWLLHVCDLRSFKLRNTSKLDSAAYSG